MSDYFFEPAPIEITPVDEDAAAHSWSCLNPCFPTENPWDPYDPFGNDPFQQIEFGSGTFEDPFTEDEWRDGLFKFETDPAGRDRWPDTTFEELPPETNSKGDVVIPVRTTFDGHEDGYAPYTTTFYYEPKFRGA